LGNFESIKFIEKQYGNIIKNSNSNIHLIVNIKQNVDQISLEYLNDFCEKNFLKPNFMNLVEYDNKNDRGFERFLNNSLVKKTVFKEKRKSLSEKGPAKISSVEVGTSKKNDCLIF
jgi:hypothetical protein